MTQQRRRRVPDSSVLITTRAAQTPTPGSADVPNRASRASSTESLACGQSGELVLLGRRRIDDRRHLQHAVGGKAAEARVLPDNLGIG